MRKTKFGFGSPNFVCQFHRNTNGGMVHALLGHGRKCGLRIADMDYGLVLRTTDSDCGLWMADYGWRTTDGGLRMAEKSEYGVHNFILTKSQHKFLFFYVKMCISNTIWSINT